MTQKEVLDELKGLVVERLKFDPRRAAEMTLETTLPKGSTDRSAWTRSTSSSSRSRSRSASAS